MIVYGSRFFLLVLTHKFSFSISNMVFYINRFRAAGISTQISLSVIHGAVGRIAAGESVDAINQLLPACHCLFFRKYFLPCWHMFQLDFSLGEGWFTGSIWDTFIDASAECGYEAYFVRERTTVEEEEGTNNTSVSNYKKLGK